MTYTHYNKTKINDGIYNPMGLPAKEFKKLTDGRVPKVITFDTETTLETLLLETPIMKSSLYKPFNHDVFGGIANDETVKQITTRNGKTKYKYLTDKAERHSIFDIGWTVHDRNTNQYIHRSFVVQETFLNMEIMKKAHYFNKYPAYIERLANGTTLLRSWLNIIARLEQDIIDYSVREVAAYNAKFDLGAIKGTSLLVTGKELTLFDDYSLQVTCLWNWATGTILRTNEFVEFALEHQLITDCGRFLKTSAEATYKFISGNVDFVEDHTALQDSIIEAKIYQKCWAVNRRAERGLPTTQPFRKVAEYAEQNGYKIERIIQEGDEINDSSISY